MSRSRSDFLYSNPGHPFNNLPAHIRSQIGSSGNNGHKIFFEDFYTFPGGADPTVEAAMDAGWALVGTTDTATWELRQEQANGVLRCLVGAAAGGNSVTRLHNYLWLYDSTKDFWCFARMALSDANDMTVYFGMTSSNNDFVAGLPADGMFFEKHETATDFDFHVRKDGTSTENALDFSATLADDTYFTIGFKVSGTGKGGNGGIIPYLSVDSATFTAGTETLSTVANVPDAATDLMYPQLGIETGASAADYVDLDWIMIVEEV
jgi:hypothetical protein